jgi:hypothetical protein
MKRLRDLPQFVGLYRTQIGELIKAGEFPKPVPLSDGGRAVAWLERQLGSLMLVAYGAGLIWSVGTKERRKRIHHVATAEAVRRWNAPAVPFMGFCRNGQRLGEKLKQSRLPGASDDSILRAAGGKQRRYGIATFAVFAGMRNWPVACTDFAIAPAARTGSQGPFPHPSDAADLTRPPAPRAFAPHRQTQRAKGQSLRLFAACQANVRIVSV